MNLRQSWWVANKEMLFSDFKKNTLVIPQIKKVVYDIPNDATIVYFMDDTTEIARLKDDDEFDKETGVLQCVAKKMYGNRSRWLKDVVNKGIVVGYKNNYLERFIRGEKIAVNCETQIEARKFTKLIKKNGCDWVNETYWDNYKENTCYTNNYKGRGVVEFSPSNFYKEKGYEIVSFKDVVK